MKDGRKARDRRADEAKRRRERWAGAADAPAPEKRAPAKPARRLRIPAERTLSPEEQAEREAAEAREFLDYLAGEIRVPADEEERRPARAPRAAVETLDLECGMPTVDEAVRRMNTGLQRLRSAGARYVRLIHGYGSTGRGGALRVGIRAELARMKRRGLIRDFIPGEDFGPFHEGSRRLVDRTPALARDPDYGKVNQGITIAAL